MGAYTQTASRILSEVARLERMGRQIQRATRVAIQNLLLSRGLEALSEVSHLVMRIDRVPLLVSLIETFLAGEKRARITAKQIGNVSPAVAREIDRRGELLSLALRPEISEILSRLRSSSAMRSLQSVSNAELWSGANATTDQLVRAANKAIESGLHKDAAIKYVAAQVPAATHHIETVWRTQNSVAYNVGLWEENEKNPVLREMVWGYEYSANGDGRTRQTHDMMDGTRAPVDHEIWRHWYPPNGYNCRCVVIPLYDDEGTYIPHPNLRPDPGFDNNIAMAASGITSGMGDQGNGVTPPLPPPEPEPMPLVSEVDIDKLKQHLEEYVGGGFASVKQVVSPEEWEWIQQHLQEYKEPIYRVEEAQFTAANLEVGSSFVFEDDLRSFTKSKAYVNQIMSSIEDEDIYMEQPVIFKTVGSTQAFEMAPYTQAYTEDQSEVLAGGNFQVVAIKTENIGGKAYTVYEIKQEGKPEPEADTSLIKPTVTPPKGSREFDATAVVVDDIKTPKAQLQDNNVSTQTTWAAAKVWYSMYQEYQKAQTLVSNIKAKGAAPVETLPTEVFNRPNETLAPRLYNEAYRRLLAEAQEIHRKALVLDAQYRFLLGGLGEIDFEKYQGNEKFAVAQANKAKGKYVEYGDDWLPTLEASKDIKSTAATQQSLSSTTVMRKIPSLLDGASVYKSTTGESIIEIEGLNNLPEEWRREVLQTLSTANPGAKVVHSHRRLKASEALELMNGMERPSQVAPIGVATNESRKMFEVLFPKVADKTQGDALNKSIKEHTAKNLGAQEKNRKLGEAGLTEMSDFLSRVGANAEWTQSKAMSFIGKTKFDYLEARAHYDGLNVINMGDLRRLGLTETLVHESGHAFDASDASAEAHSQVFLAAITDNKKTKQVEYIKGEMCYSPTIKMPSLYCTKKYRIGSEVYSMALEEIYRNPAAFVEEYPEYFEWCWAHMHGDWDAPMPKSAKGTKKSNK